MTEQVDVPVTRRALRAAAEAAAAAAAEDVSSAAPGPAAAPTPTRRALREAERAREARTGDLVTQTPSVTATPAPAARPAPAVRPAPSVRPAVSTQPAPTRRELRTAGLHTTSVSAPGAVATTAAQVCRPPFAATVVLPTQPTRASQARAALSRLGAKPAVVVTLAAGLLVGGVTQVHAEQGTVAAARAAAEVAAEEDRRDRVANASSARLAASAAAYASDRRTEALAAAEEAVTVAEGVRLNAESVVDPQILTSLDEAAAELAALLEANPAVEELQEIVVPAPATPADDPDPATDPGTEVVDGTDAAAAAEGDDVDTTGTSSTSSTVETLDAADDTVEAVRAVRTSRVGPLTEDAPAAGRAALAARETQALREQLESLDLTVTERIIAAASEVSALSEQVRTEAEARIAEEQARLAAEEAARLAAEQAAAAAAAELVRKVDLAEASTNGRIPQDALCGVSFDTSTLLRCDAAAALEVLNEAYRADFGRDLSVVSSYRSYDAQVSTRRSRGSLAATPGTSNHGRGLAVDFGGFGGLGNFGTANYRWMRANAERFGWHHPAIMRPGGGGPQEPWHWEFGTR